ncbi:MAG: NADH-quinone oxidoreductase subunit J [Bacillota bacterium]
MNLTLLMILSFLMVISVLGAVMLRDLLKATICLALASVILAVILFIMEAPLAAVFELSVCAGLITVVFVSAIALTKPSTPEELAEKVKERRQRFIHLPFIIVALGAVLWVLLPNLQLNWLVPNITTDLTVREAIWNIRQMEILGQIIIVLCGVFGVVVLFKERDNQ